MIRKKVLIVEDDFVRQGKWIRKLDDLVEILSAVSIKQAEEKFAGNPDIACIVMDACVPGDDINTESLVHSFRKKFKGPIIAISSISQYIARLALAGCDYACEKDGVPEKIREVLGLP